MKYNRIQLRKMAKHLLAIETTDQDTYTRFMFAVALRTNETMVHVGIKIDRYAKGDIL